MAKKRRFYRPPPPLSNLPRIVWGPKQNKAIAEFGKANDPEYPNQFLTDNQDTAETLLKLGYREVSLDAEAPPYVPEMKAEEIGSVKILPEGFTEVHEVQKIRREALMKKALEEAEPAPVPEKKKPAEKITPPIAKAQPASTKKKVLKRRIK